MRVLVTGSSGLVGACLSDLFRTAGIEVIPFDLRHDGADIRDADTLRAAMDGCDGVIHLAAISRVAWGQDEPDLTNAINVDGTANVAEVALSLDRRPWMILASSREVYGSLVRLPAVESDPLKPVNVYGRSKLASERIVTKAQRNGLRTAILRLSNVYGTTNDHPGRAVPSLLSCAMAGQGLSISGAETFFDFVHVDDCVRAFLTVAHQLDAGGTVPVLHLVTGVSTSLGQLALAAANVARSSSPLTVLPARSFDVPGFVGNPALAEKSIGWTAAISLREGLEHLRDELSARNGPMDDVTMPPPAALTTLRSRRTLETQGRAR
jgi:nucleoside-diphosphate-sugar epimerase